MDGLRGVSQTIGVLSLVLAVRSNCNVSESVIVIGIHHEDDETAAPPPGLVELSNAISTASANGFWLKRKKKRVNENDKCALQDY